MISDISDAASNNHEAVVRWLVEHQRDNDDGSETGLGRDASAARTHPRVPQAVENLIGGIHSAAGLGGNLDMVKYLYEHLQSKRRGLDPSTSTYLQDKLGSSVAIAAGSGHVNIVQWLIDAEFREDPSEVLAEALLLAVQRARFPVVRWIWSHPALAEQGKARRVERLNLADRLLAATRRANFAMLEWICARTDEFVSVLNRSIELGNVEIMQWLVGETFRGGDATEWTLTARDRRELIESTRRHRARCIQKWLISA